MEIAQHMDAFVTLVVAVGVLAGLVWNRWPAEWLMMAAAVSLILLGINAFALIVVAMAMAILRLGVRLRPLYRHLLTAYLGHGCRLLFKVAQEKATWLGYFQGKVFGVGC